MSKRTINRPQLILEFLSVVFAVLLALLLNSWRENAATNRALDKVMRTIQKEIISNDSAIRASRDYHLDLIRELYRYDHLIMEFPTTEFPIDVRNDEALEKHLKEILPFSQATPISRLEVKSLGNYRIVVVNDRTLKLKLQNDTLKFYGPYNLQLRSANISNRSWEIAKATGTLVEMDLELVDALNQVYTLNNHYIITSDKAIDMIYNSDPAIRSVLEDMYYYENQIIKADSVVMNMLDLD
ncbi:MAG: hypothetical protein ABJG47_14225 [Ekhidna sp.]